MGAAGETGISYLQLATLRLSGRFSSSTIPVPLFTRRNLINARKRTNSADQGTAGYSTIIRIDHSRSISTTTIAIVTPPPPPPPPPISTTVSVRIRAWRTSRRIAADRPLFLTSRPRLRRPFDSRLVSKGLGLGTYFPKRVE